ncbi:unnamed protein product [Rotaria sp. Silwood2]|nr:unnamed protein product [Rotaria sp. Silwood2]CAF3324237.1 unnamed protein product [Rotaria sp. Silwood2]CAF4474312.1 unnamed protein product [Rotaria sp. Silwood2]CAF4484960.1 unnamed protein product [Rotaria sp. Silwood2]
MITQSTTHVQHKNQLLYFISNLNLYNDYDEMTLTGQLLSTRVFVVLLSIALVIILAFTGIIPQTRAFTVYSPSVNEFESFINRYPTATACRCSQTSISYLQFVSFNPQFHQVCSSNFINEEWFSSLFNANTSNYYPLDFRLVASAQLQVLSLLCRISHGVVIDALKGLASASVFSLNALSRDVLHSYIDTSIEQFKKNTLNNFHLHNHFVLSLVSEHRFISALRTNFYTRSVPGSNIFETFSAIYPQQVNQTQSSSMSNEICRCDQKNHCIYPAGIYNQSKAIIPNEVFSLDEPSLFIVPGFQVGCIPQNALLHSTLECFYNQSCLDMVISLTGALSTVSILNISNPSRFNPTTTINVLFDNLMIESWKNSTDFEAYFQTCAPKSCSYSYIQRFFLIYMITTMASVFGGLIVVLRIASPLLLKFILHFCPQEVRTLEADEEHEPNRNFKDRIRNFIKLVGHKVTTFNLFATTFTNVRHGIYSTRVYIILLMLGIYTLTIYSTSIVSSQRITIKNPSPDQFEHLYAMYSSILSCPCRYSLIPRSTFISNDIKIHSFCTSSFVHDDRWFQYWKMEFLNGTIDPNPLFHWTDFRKNGLKFFNYAKICCDIANRTLSNIMNSFQDEYFVSPQPLSQLEFNETTYMWETYLQMQIGQIYWAKLYQVEESIRQGGLISFDFIDPSLVSNHINNAWILKYGSDNTNIFNNRPCDCEEVQVCLKSLGFYSNSLLSAQTDIISGQIIPGLYLGCTLLDFSFSTLECFYNQLCVQMLIDQRLYGYENIYLPINLTNITALDPNDVITMELQDPFLFLMRTAFVDQWIYIKNYTSYYAHCQPQICTYTIQQKLHHFAYVNLVIGLIGGLTVLLRVFVPLFIKIIYLIYHLCRRQTRGIVVGCSIMDGLSQSTFECFYDDVCVNQLNRVLGSSFTTFNLNATPFSPTTSIGSILDDYYRISYAVSLNYSAYFQECAPSICQYHRAEPNNIVYIFTTLLGLYGGLTASLHICVWYLLRLRRIIVQHCSWRLRRIHPSP